MIAQKIFHRRNVKILDFFDFWLEEILVPNDK